MFTVIANALRETYEGIDVTSEYVLVPSSFPSVSIEEADNRVVERMRTLKIENAVHVMYEVNIYTNKAATKKSEAKAIANTIDEEFEKIGFTRTMKNRIPNINNASIYRIVCRYEAIVDKDLWIYHS